MKLEKANIAMGLAGGTPWQRTYTHEQVARLHFGHVKNQTDRKNEARPCERALRTACEHGTLVHVVETTPGTPARRSYNEFTRDYYTIPGTPDRKLLHIEASAAAAWFTSQGEAPGELLKAWFTSQGVGTAVSTPAPAAETVTDRNARWLKVWDEENPTHAPGSQARAIARIVDAEGAKPDTVKKGLQSAEKARDEARRGGNVSPMLKRKKAPANPFPTTVHRMK